MKALKDDIFVVALSVLVLVLLDGFIKGWTDSGPGCPKDPAWLGWCEDIPETPNP